MLLSTPSSWAVLAFLIGATNGSPGGDHYQHSSYVKEPTDGYGHVCTSDIIITDTKTIFATTTIPKTHYVDVTVSHYVNITVSSTKTSTISTCITESSTTTLYYTVSITKTDSETTTDTVSVTETDSATITNTETTTATVPATITTYTTETVFSTTYDPCPTTCSISAGTVNLFFWPTDRPYTYPSTYYDTALDYTFTSPSVYMLIPTAVGTNSAGRAGPATTDWILPLDLEEVSTIVGGTATVQLVLSDLGTDCPQTAEPSAIATMVDSRCDPILAAPKQVSSWAYPCNACGRFGLFDPPYAIPTVTGGLIPTTTAVAPTVTSTLGVSTPVISSTPTTQAVPSTPPSTAISSSVPTTRAVTSSSSSALPSSSPAGSSTTVATAAGSRLTSGLALFISSILMAVRLF